jgi:hypothetical protein
MEKINQTSLRIEDLQDKRLHIPAKDEFSLGRDGIRLNGEMKTLERRHLTTSNPVSSTRGAQEEEGTALVDLPAIILRSPNYHIAKIIPVHVSRGCYRRAEGAE